MAGAVRDLVGWLIARDSPVVFVTDASVVEDDVAWAALTVGFEELAGVLEGGMDAWQAAARPVATTPLLEAGDIAGRRVVDIRQRPEYAAGHAAGADHVELGELTDDAAEVVAGPLLVHCGHGERAMSAASLLERAGHQDVAVLAGGPDDLAAAGHRLETEA